MHEFLIKIAIDYLQKSNCELLLPAIIRHMNKEFSPGTILAKSYASLRRENIARSLTDQEYQVLEQLSQNASRTQILETLIIEGKAFFEVLLENIGGPNAELGGS